MYFIIFVFDIVRYGVVNSADKQFTLLCHDYFASRVLWGMSIYQVTSITVAMYYLTLS